MHSKRYHIVCDLAECNQKIKDRNSVTKFLRELVKRVDMSILAGPYSAVGIPENPGVSAFVIIDYSHISIHTFTKYNEALIDIFSCKAYSRNIVMDYCIEYFGANAKLSRIKEVWWG